MRNVSNALFKYEKASEDQAKHVSNILSADQSSNGNLKEEIKNKCLMNDKAEVKRVEKNFSIFEYIHLINQARGPYWENIGPRS